MLTRLYSQSDQYLRSCPEPSASLEGLEQPDLLIDERLLPGHPTAGTRFHVLKARAHTDSKVFRNVVGVWLSDMTGQLFSSSVRCLNDALRASRSITIAPMLCRLPCLRAVSQYAAACVRTIAQYSTGRKALLEADWICLVLLLSVERTRNS